MIYRNREEGARQLAGLLSSLSLRDPLVLAIPRGGLVTGSVLAGILGAELDVILARKMRAPLQHELAMGAVCEEGEVYLAPYAASLPGFSQHYLELEKRRQLEIIASRKDLFRAVRARARMAGRSVILTDDGIATGSTVKAALHVVKGHGVHEAIVAVPVGAVESLAELEGECDRVLCPLRPQPFYAVAQHYEDFSQLEDEEVLRLFRERVAGVSERALGVAAGLG